ncbi:MULTISPECIES: hypothetical protein [unclassified Caballeronia]|uniref:hypothetical protein n=1 Tax=unclassified Caballeronia TaxID=2646786 RepID=UPI0020288A40|nr:MULTISPECIES: hypothetical protein [unclassified Caballeronia]MDR5763812.1 hypothetical protein [Caballeronia sp. LZ028]
MLPTQTTPRSLSLTAARQRARELLEFDLPFWLRVIISLAFGCQAVWLVVPTIWPEQTFGHALRVTFIVVVSVAAIAYDGLGALLGGTAARLRLVWKASKQSQHFIAQHYRLPPLLDSQESPTLVVGEVHPTRSYSGDGHRLTYGTGAELAPQPEWFALPLAGLVTGILVLGATGSGKTAYFIQSAVFRLLGHGSRPGALVADSKAALIGPLVRSLHEAGRLDDLRVVGLRHPETRWNPLHRPADDPATLAESFMQALEAINGGGFEPASRWIRHGARALLEGAIGILRLTNAGYVTAQAVLMLLQQLQLLAQGNDEPGKAAQGFLIALCDGFEFDEEKREQQDYYQNRLVQVFAEEDKLRAIYLSEIYQLLTPLVAPGARQVYNPPESEITLPDWPTVIDQGLIVALDCSLFETPGLAQLLGVTLKLGYQQAILNRLAGRDGLEPEERAMLLIIDEAQDMVTAGDEAFQALARAARSITIYATQGIPSLEQRLGEVATRVLVQSLRNLVVLTQTAPDKVADLLGQHNRRLVETSINETVTDAALTAAGRFAGDSTVAQSFNVREQREHIVPPEVLRNLPTGQAIVAGFDGKSELPLCRVFLHPYFRPIETRFTDLGA